MLATAHVLRVCRWVREHDHPDTILTGEYPNGEHARPKLVGAIGRLGGGGARGDGSYGSGDDAVLAPILGL